eukprot:TRINITY_DN1858_c0_g1_i6.p1 TRINITY_DN1858_c0_g1~~TRINITY_DN1858_c0_g1_i6.p1  ORF type:complete len:344 (-),score=67.92 TRINITY_DN1858_c0_g1_i6:62-1093(-)
MCIRDSKKASSVRSLLYLAKRSKSVTSATAQAAGQQNEPEQPPFTELQRDFLEPKGFYDLLKNKGVEFFTGVPDSLLKDFCAFVQDNVEPKNHIITPNEGLAVSLASGYHLATGKYPLVYFQNSGLGNTVNPLLSMAHAQIYSIPMLLLIGWRGEPGKKDEPQHYVQGKVMNGLLTEMGIQYEVLPDFYEGAEKSVESALFHLQNRNSPYALVVRRQTFLNYKLQNKAKNDMPLNREEATKIIVDNIGDHDAIVGTTGFLSRELWEIRARRQQSHERDFLTVGAMGHASSIALGIALAKPSRNVFCLDGDGALLMHMGALTTVGTSNCSNIKHIVLNLSLIHI